MLAAEFPIERRLYRTEPDVQVLVCSQRPHGDARGEIVHGPRPGRVGGRWLHPEPEHRGPAGRIRGASLSHAHLRRHGAPLPDPLPRRPDQRSAGSVTRIPQGRPRAGISRRFFAGRERGAQTRRRMGESAPGLSCRRLQRLGAARSGGLRAPHRRARQSRVRGAICARHAGAPVRHGPLPERAISRACAACSNWTTGSPRPPSVSAMRPTITALSPPSAICAGLRVPALLIQAKDDTFVPFAIYESAAVRSNPWIQLMATEYGGHLGFIGRGPNRLWSDEVIMEWIAGVAVKKTPCRIVKGLRSK